MMNWTFRTYITHVEKLKHNHVVMMWEKVCAALQLHEGFYSLDKTACAAIGFVQTDSSEYQRLPDALRQSIEALIRLSGEEPRPLAHLRRQ